MSLGRKIQGERPEQVLETRFGSFSAFSSGLRPLVYMVQTWEVCLFSGWIHPLTLQLFFPWEWGWRVDQRKSKMGLSLLQNPGQLPLLFTSKGSVVLMGLMSRGSSTGRDVSTRACVSHDPQPLLSLELNGSIQSGRQQWKAKIGPLRGQYKL